MKRIKICGLTRPEDILYVNEAKPDYIGFVFAENRRRTLTRDKAFELKKLLFNDIKAVGVFLNNDVDYVISLVRDGIIDIVQLHGDEDEKYIHYLRAHIKAPIIKAVRALSTERILEAEKMDVDYLLIDTYEKGVAGGTGKVFDWRIIPKLRKPYFLAGGLDPDNIREAMKTNAFALDMSSGVETDGIKDREKILRTVKTVRGE